jgi:hypothetical protein
MNTKFMPSLGLDIEMIFTMANDGRKKILPRKV